MTDEVVIAGGGIIGLSLAFELRERGQPVRVLLPGDDTGTATAAAAGMLAPVSEADVEHPRLIPLALDSLSRYPDFVARVEAVSDTDCGYRTEGTLWAALHRDHHAELDHLQRFMADRGMTAQPLDARDLRRLEPALSPRVTGGCRIGGDHQVDPRALRAALLTALQRLGARLERDSRVVAVRCSRGALSGLRIARSTGQTWLGCSHAVLATGAWLGGDLCRELPDFGMRPVRGQTLRLRGALRLGHVVRTPDVYLVPRANGRLVVGASSEEQGFDSRISAGATFELLRHAIAAVPGVQELELEEIPVGFRPATRDHLPVMGATAVAGLHVSGGHFRNGILLAPASAAHLANQLGTGRSEPELAPFSPQRFESVSCPTRN